MKKMLEKRFYGHSFLGIYTAQSVRKYIRCEPYKLTFTNKVILSQNLCYVSSTKF